MDKKTGGVSDGDDTCQGCGAALESDGAERDEFLQSRENLGSKETGTFLTHSG